MAKGRNFPTSSPRHSRGQAHIFIRCLRRWSRGLRDLPLPAPSHSRPRLAGPSVIAGLKTLSLRPWHGPFHLPFNHRSPWRALVDVAARAPWRRRPPHRSGMGGAVGPVKIRTRPYSLSKGSGYRATTRLAQPDFSSVPIFLRSPR
jgi:hypothetical protein